VNVTGTPGGGDPDPTPTNKPLQLSVRRTSPTQLMLTVRGESGQRFRVDWSIDLRRWSQWSEGVLVGTTSEIPITIDSSKRTVTVRTTNLP
jgi:hypothetical protein